MKLKTKPALKLNFLLALCVSISGAYKKLSSALFFWRGEDAFVDEEMWLLNVWASLLIPLQKWWKIYAKEASGILSIDWTYLKEAVQDVSYRYSFGMDSSFVQ